MRPTTGPIQVLAPRPALSDGRRTELIERAIDQLPTLSVVATRLLQISGADRADMAEIVRMIESDPALSARLVGLCRRADKGLGDRITTARRAVLMLGFDAVRSAALSVSVYDVVRRSAAERTDSTDHPAFDRDGFWRHSICVACACELIAQTHPRLRLQPQEAFLCGLLHAVGKMALDHVLPRAYDNVVRQAMRRGSAVAPIERAILGVDHLTAGRRIAQHWCLPDSVVKVLGGDMEPETPAGPESVIVPGSARTDAVTSVVRAAKALCRWLNLGWACEFDVPQHPGVVWRQAGLLPQGPSLITEQLIESVADRFKILGLAGDTAAKVALDAVEQAATTISETRTQMHEVAVRGDRVAAAAESLAALGVAMARGGDAKRAAMTSMRTVLGTPGVWLLSRADSGEGWMVEEGGDGRAQKIAEPMPPGAHSALAAESVKRPASALSCLVVGLSPWLKACIPADASRLRATVLLWSREGEGPCAVVLTDGEPGAAVPAGTLHAACALWREALVACNEDAGPGSSRARGTVANNTPVVVTLASAAGAAEEGARTVDHAVTEVRSLVDQVRRVSGSAPPSPG